MLPLRASEHARNRIRLTQPLETHPANLFSRANCQDQFNCPELPFHSLRHDRANLRLVLRHTIQMERIFVSSQRPPQTLLQLHAPATQNPSLGLVTSRVGEKN